MKKKCYTVRWEGVFWDTTPEGAARQAMFALRDTGTDFYSDYAMRFLVTDSNESVFVDLMHKPPLQGMKLP